MDNPYEVMLIQLGQSDISPAGILDMETKLSNNGKYKIIANRNDKDISGFKYQCKNEKSKYDILK